jgi:hypothetical protein
VAENLRPRGLTLPPCETQPTHEYQIRPLVVLEPTQQFEVWEETVRSADGGQGLPFPNAGDFREWRISRRNRRNGVRPGIGRRWAGAVAASGIVPADPWPRGKVTPGFPLGASFRGRGEGVTALTAVDLSFRGGGLGAHFGVPVSPPSEVLSSPQMRVQDIETIAGIFPGKVIIVDHGKIAMLGSWAHVFFCEGVRVRFPLGTRPLLSWTPKSQF